MTINYKQLILERLAMLREDVKRDVADFLDSIHGYSYTKIEVTLKGWYTTRLFKKGTTYNYDDSVALEIIPNRAVGGQEIKQIDLKEPQSQQIIDAVDKAVEKQFPTFERKSGNVDGFIRWEDVGNKQPEQTNDSKEEENEQEI